MNIDSIPGRRGFSPRRQKFGIVPLGIMLLAGVVFVAVSVPLVTSLRVDPDWEQTSGRVMSVSGRMSDGTMMYSPVVEYEVDGRQY